MKNSGEQCSLAGMFKDQQGDLCLEQNEGKNGRLEEEVSEVIEDRLCTASKATKGLLLLF